MKIMKSKIHLTGGKTSGILMIATISKKQLRTTSPGKQISIKLFIDAVISMATGGGYSHVVTL